MPFREIDCMVYRWEDADDWNLPETLDWMWRFELTPHISTFPHFHTSTPSHLLLAPHFIHAPETPAAIPRSYRNITHIPHTPSLFPMRIHARSKTHSRYPISLMLTGGKGAERAFTHRTKESVPCSIISSSRKTLPAIQHNEEKHVYPTP